MQTRLGHWGDGEPVKLRFMITSCKLAFPERNHCEPCFKRQPDFYGPKQYNMHNLCIRACCNCIHIMDVMTEMEWKSFCDWLGFDYSIFQFSNEAPKEVKAFVSNLKRAKRCKMCKEEDAEIKGYCEDCYSFRERNGLSI